MSINDNEGLNEQPAPVAPAKQSPSSDVDADYVGMVKVVNNLTGEIMEREYNSVHDVKNLFLELDATLKALTKARDQMRSLLTAFMANHQEYEFADGSRIKWINTQKVTYNFTELTRFMDQDVVALFATINKTELESFLADEVRSKQMTHEQKDQIMQTATTEPGSSYIKVQR